MYSTFRYQAGSWTKPRWVVAKVEWHLGERFPRVGFIVTNTARRSRNVVGFYNRRGTAEQNIKEGKGAIKWTRLSCRTFTANAVRLHLHALAYNLGNFMRTLVTKARASPLEPEEGNRAAHCFAIRGFPAERLPGNRSVPRGKVLP